jgi:signal transduction histidine kinase
MNKRDDTFKHDLSELSSQAEGHITLHVGHENLLYAVVAACECMVTHTDLIVGLQAAMEQLGRLSGHDRAYVWELTEEQTVCVLVAEWDAPGIPRATDMAGTDRFAVADFEEVWMPLLAGQAYQSVTPVKTDANARLNEAVANRSDLMVPIFVSTRCWGCIGFDNCTEERRYSPAEIQALRGAAAAISAAVQRCESEARRIAAERARAEESDRLATLLTQVVNSSRRLIDTELQAFESALLAWLGGFGSAVGAMRCTFYDLVDFESTGLRTTRILAEWVRDGIQGSMPVSFAAPITIDPRGAEPLMEQLTAGQAVTVHTEDTVSPMREFLAQQSHATVVAVPLVMDGKPWGALSFDHAQRREPSPGEFAVLHTAADTLAAILKRNEALRQMLAERDLRIASEQDRADEAARHAARIERHSRLLAAVATSAEELLASADPADCMGAVLARVGEVTHAERVCLARLDWTPQDPALHGWQEIAHEWARPGVARQMDGPLRRFAMQRGDATWDRALKQFANERRILVTIDTLDEPFRSEQLALGIVWTLCYPVLLEGQVWGLMGMDYATPFTDYDEADLAALQTVATTVADAMLRRTLEQRALATERARVDEAQALNHLLESVVQSSRELLDAPDFKAGLQQWLEVLASAVDADVAMLGSQAPDAEGASLADWSVHWAKAANHSTLPVPATADFIDWHARLQQGEAVWAHREELLDPASVRHWQDIDCWTNLLMPVVSAVGTLGVLCFDWRERREWQPAYGTVLRTAADSVAAAIQRHEATQALLAEREARLVAEQQHSSELARANAALRTSIKALSDSANADGFMRQVLHEIWTHSGAGSAYLFQAIGHDKKLRILGGVREGKFSVNGWPDDPDMFLSGFELLSSLREMLTPGSRLVWHPVEHYVVPTEEMSGSPKWHLSQPLGISAVHALLVGERLVGLVGLAVESDTPLSASQEEVIHALCQPLALALELVRLAKLAQRNSEQSAILSERNRLAREIHDGIAQNFLAIQMQIDSLELPVQQLNPIVRAMEMAKTGLQEARRAVAALRPHELLNHDLSVGLKRLLAQMTAGSTIEPIFESTADWQRLPLDVEDHLFRIVQEALNNALKHAKARRLRVELSQSVGEVTILIADDGIGFDVAQIHLLGERDDYSGYGLVGMEQRAKLINARIEYQTGPTKGTQVLLSWSASSGSEQHNETQRG